MIENSEGPSDGDARKIVELDLEYETMRELQNELAPLLSNDGLFIPCKEPVETDAVVRFKVMLPDRFTLIQGTGVVVWSRGEGDEHGPPGVAVRYASLPSSTQETIDAIIDAHLASGGTLFNLEPDSEPSESYPTDALDHRSLDERGAVRRAPSQVANVPSDLERARLEIRDEVEPPPASAPAIDEGAGASGEDDYFASVEAQVQEAIASVRDKVTQVTEPVDQELLELTTDVEDTAAPESDTPQPSQEPDGESVIPEILDKWRHEVEAGSGDGEGAARAQFESGIDDVVTDAMDVRGADSGAGELAAGAEAAPATSGGPRWWLVALGVAIVVLVVGYVIWLWSFGGRTQRPVPQVVEETVQPPEDVVSVGDEQQPEPEVGAADETEAAPPPAPLPEPPTEPATVIDSIVWGTRPEGTEVVIRGNGVIPESTVETFGLSEPPRILVRIRGIQQEYSAYELPVGSPEIEKIRVGHHPELTPQALYVVLDLARPDVRVTDVSFEGDTVRVTVQ